MEQITPRLLQVELHVRCKRPLGHHNAPMSRGLFSVLGRLPLQTNISLQPVSLGSSGKRTETLFFTTRSVPYGAPQRAGEELLRFVSRATETW